MTPGFEELDRRLHSGLNDLGLPVSKERRETMMKYLALLEKWGRTYNLTGILDRPAMVTHHLLDSLCATPYIHGDRMLDVGSGAGLPGIPIAVALPHLSVTLIESRKKKAQFLIHVSTTLGLTNIETVCERVERYRPANKFDTLVTRAFSRIGEFVDQAGHLCNSGGRMVALKGVHPAEELPDLEDRGFTTTAVHAVKVPGLAAQRHIVVLTQRAQGLTT